MQLESIKYSQFKNEPNEWDLLEVRFGKINLIVGKNASGKSRTINIISNLAKLLSGKVKPTFSSSNFRVSFKGGNKEIKYNLSISTDGVTKEELISDDKFLLKRGKTGKGKIVTFPKQDSVAFQTPVTELTSNSRRDSLQHPFFEDLYEWGANLNVYRFGTNLGQDTMMLFQEESKNAIHKEVEGFLKVFKEGKTKYRKKFLDSIIKDMKKVGYEIKSLELGKPNNISTDMGLLALNLQEKDVNMSLSHSELSQGMFRALSLIIQINYFSLSNKPSCILIDDIGEGLDFERSTNLISLLIAKAETSDVQLIMSTNDRFVMNHVPLKYWSIIQRVANGSAIFNYSNSKKVFDDFEFTGLNNFDFFSKKFFEKGFKK